MQALTGRQCRAAKARLKERRPLAMLQVCLQSSLDTQQSWVTCHSDCHDSNVVQFVIESDDAESVMGHMLYSLY